MLAIKGRKTPEKPQVTRMRRGSLSRAHIYVQHIYTRVSVCERVGGTRGGERGRARRGGGGGGGRTVATESKIERKSASESRFESHGVVIARRAIARLVGVSVVCWNGASG